MLLRIVKICMICIMYVSGDEPHSHRPCDCEYRVLEKLAQLEAKQTILQETVTVQQETFTAQQTVIQNLQQQLSDTQLREWSSWSVWSHCKWNCTNGETGRIQSRSRQAIIPGGQSQTQTEERPCNAVQFAGCEASTGENDQFYGVTYDYKDEMAQATCTAMSSSGGNIYAARRHCSSLTVSCAVLCTSLGMTCFNALHVYNPAATLTRSQTGSTALHMYRYNSCVRSDCGPNFCCCQK